MTGRSIPKISPKLPAVTSRVPLVRPTKNLTLGGRSGARVRSVPKSVLIGVLALFGAALGAWGLSQRLRPTPMPPVLAFLLDNRLTRAVVGPELLLDRARVGPDLRILDAGCGPGRVTLPAARRVLPNGYVVALDRQEAMLDKLRARLQTGGIGNVVPLRGELGAGEISGRSPGSGPFDRVLMTMVTGEVRWRNEAFKELYEVLAPGGLLSITETLEPDYRRWRTVRHEVERSGFRFERLYRGSISYTMNFTKPPASD